ncbi:MAG: YhcH/YjgK/YiaL family protein [Verrucomicrobiae bacterium]|nr:YhcH/YjgK/YiaL family protein [Verrucomicrobiae bacterium]
MIFDSLQNASNYNMGPAWTTAFDFLKSIDADTPDGEYPIDGDTMFARVMSYETKAPADAKFEAHQKYADIQSTLIGAEGIAVVDTSKAKVRVPYDQTKDVAFFDAPETIPGLVDVYPGSFAFLLPQDCHMPQLAVGESKRIKKVVVKIALSALGL